MWTKLFITFLLVKICSFKRVPSFGGTQIRHGHALLRQIKDQLKNDEWHNDTKTTTELLSKLFTIECHMISTKLDNKNAISDNLAVIKEQTANICGTDNNKMEQIGIQKLMDNVNVTFEKDGNKMVDEMRKAEQTIKVHIDGEYGTLADILPKTKKLPKGAKMRTYRAVLHLLELISRRMEDGSAKEQMTELIKNGNGTMEMPSELVGLSMALWSQFYKQNGKAINEALHQHELHNNRRHRRWARNELLYRCANILFAFVLALFVLVAFMSQLTTPSNSLGFMLVSATILLIHVYNMEQSPPLNPVQLQQTNLRQITGNTEPIKNQIVMHKSVNTMGETQNVMQEMEYKMPEMHAKMRKQNRLAEMQTNGIIDTVQNANGMSNEWEESAKSEEGNA